jgi:ABC-type Na+ efflux pump permease subunit
MPASDGRKGKTGAAPSPDPVFLYGGLGATLIGAVVLAGVLFFNSKDVARQKALVPAVGAVVAQQSQNSGTQSRVVLTVRFTSAAGRTVDFPVVYGSKTTTRPAKGDAVAVLYDPADPTKAELQASNLLGYALSGAVGLGFLLMGLTIVVRTIREWRRRTARALRAGT